MSTSNTCPPGGNDILDSEFLYLSALIRVVAPALTNTTDRRLIQPWIRKLYSPEYSTRRFREKRNKFLLYLTLSLLNNRVSGIFVQPPSMGKLPELSSLCVSMPKANWEKENMWQEYLRVSACGEAPKCSIHEERCPDIGAEFGEALDRQFLLFLHIAKPYAALLSNSKDLLRAASWLRHLCSVGPDACIVVKGIRNDYIMSLMGYLHHQQLAGPFLEFPTPGSMPSLAEAAKYAADRNNILNPFSEQTNSFLESVPSVPDNGAFAFVAIAGEVLTELLRTKQPDELSYCQY